MPRRYSKRGAALKFIVDIAVNYEDDECLLWPFGTSSGYGNIRIDGVKHYTHRLVCELVYGAPPSESLDCAHSCGVRRCVNPSHLRWATRLENVQDAIDHGTYAHGEWVPNAVLDVNSVCEIRRRYADEGVTQKALAEEYGVANATIGRVVNKINWKHV